jgi:hypothetical protein
VKPLLSKRTLAAACLLLSALFVLRPEAGWIRGKVTNSLSLALGRNVQIGSVRLRFFPRPGFELQDLVVFDNPAFGAEPLLRAPDVNAALRLSSLVRGRMELSRLTLNQSSLNLTRNPQGKLNIEDLLDRTARSSMAPTGTRQRTTGPSFPYIEGTEARVNFKLGAEKIHFALTNAEFALWQESEDAWAARLQARPIRTDANLTDTGMINVSGLWRRSAQVHQMPLEITFQWKHAQIGQLSKLVYGVDQGWRGGLLLSGTVLGTPEHLRLMADAAVDDFRRQDVIGGGNLRLAAHCSAEYNSAAREVSDLDCIAPSGGGYLQLKGSAAGWLENGKPFSTSDLWLMVRQTPAESVVAAARHVNARFPQDLTASGVLNATVQIARKDLNRPVLIQGSGSLDQLAVARGGSDSAIDLATVPLAIRNGAAEGAPAVSQVSVSAKNRSRPQDRKAQGGPELQVELGPVSLSPGKLTPLLAQGRLSREGYQASAHGETGVKPLLQIAGALGIPSPAISADGGANVNLKLAGQWGEGGSPLVTGSMHLHSVRAQVRGINAPIEVLSADLGIEPEAVTVQNLAAAFAETTWHGSVRIPRPCASASACQVQFKLRTAELNANALNTAVNPALGPRVWYRVLSLGDDQPSYLLQVRASGKLAVDKLTIGESLCSHFTSDLRLDAGRVSLSGFRGDFLEGTATGNWEANFASKPPQHRGSGTFVGLSLDGVAALMNNKWIEGVASAEYDFTAYGGSLQDVLASADLSARFTARQTTFPRVVLTRESIPLRADEFSGHLRLSDGTFSLDEAKLVRGNEVYTMSGTASTAGTLNLKAASDTASGFIVTGTWLKTRVSAIPNAEASLKP